MSSTRVRAQVDRLWDAAWANGVTDPLACVEVLAVVLLASTRPRLQSALARGAPDAIAREVARLPLAAGAGPERAGALLARDPHLGATLLALVGDVRGDAPQDALGDVYEHVLARMATAGHYGQFRTPHHLVDFVVSLADPKPGEVVLDPACGTGSFLVAAARLGASPASLRGEEIDPAVARLAQLNVVLHGLRGATIVTTDGLQEATAADVILANPPFGGVVRAGVADRFTSPSAKTELLFLEHIADRVSEGGRAAVIVPWGVIANRTQGSDAVRRRLLDDNDLRAVIELPAGAFLPYTDSRTAVLVWAKGAKTSSVLFARVRADGFSLDDRRRPVARDDLPAVLADFRSGAGARVDAADVRAGGYLFTPSRYLSRAPRHSGGRTHVDRLDRALAALPPAVAGLERAVASIPTGTSSTTGPTSAPRATSPLPPTSASPAPASSPAVASSGTDDKERRRAHTRFGAPVPGTVGEHVLFCTAARDADQIAPSTPYVGLEHLEVATGACRWVPAGEVGLRSPKGVFRRGDVLYGRLRPNLRKCCVADVDGVCSADIFVLRPHDPTLGPLLAAYLRSDDVAAHAAELATGANLPRLAARDLLALPLVLPTEPDRSRLASMAAGARQARAAAAELDRALGELEAGVAASLRAGDEVPSERELTRGLD